MDECVRVLDHMPERNPTDGTFELTIRCNLHCKMCLFRHDDSENAEIMAKELTAAQWIDMARQVAEAGTLSLLITGGEPMLRPDFCEIWEGIYKQGFVITLYTNATLVTPKIMETLRKYPPHRIGITFYGSNPETYERVTGSAKAFELALQGARELITLPSKMVFRMTIIRDNANDVHEIEEMVHREFGEDHLVSFAFRIHQPVRGGCADAVSCRLPPSEYIDLLFRNTIREIKNDFGDFIDEDRLLLRVSQKTSDRESPSVYSLFGCHAGMDSYTVSYSGKLLGCQLLGMFSTDAVKDGFLSAWEEYPYCVSLPDRNPQCLMCENREYCNTCYASRYAETGDLSGVPEYACAEARYLKSLADY
ncbi:MAG: radical SAM protein [Eubacteriales bacterium]|nr:radical SAM protein [Eubacteriales bacterium]